MKVAYLAQPIDLTGGAANHDAVECEIALQRAGFSVYKPAGAWRTTKPDPRIEQVNQTALRSADLLVAVLSTITPSIGVPMEIADALHLGIPVIAVYDHDSFALARPGIKQITEVKWLAAGIQQLDEDGRFDHSERIEPIRVVLQPGSEIPIRAYADDAGLDLTVARDYVIESGAFVDLHTQVESVQLPVGYWGMITGRSSTLRKHRLHVPQAVIDPGWRGPLYVGAWNLGFNPVKLVAGTRIGQIILIPNHPAPVAAVDQVEPAPRGLAGFGSTG
jgi:deoxyuridine 5'-triphosphate nucleotidohydrolase